MNKERTHASASLRHSLVEEKIGRRTLFKGLAAASAAAAAAMVPLQLQRASGLEMTGAAAAPLTNPRLIFSPIGPSMDDDVVLPPGYSYDLLVSYGEEIAVGAKVGYNHDWIGYYPIDMLETGADLKAVHKGFTKAEQSSTEGLLVVNHEYTNPMFVSNYAGEGPKNAEQLALEQDAVGLAVERLKQGEDGVWAVVKDAPENRCITAITPILLTGPAAEINGGPEAIGLLANCSGGATPWGTALSCEENFQDYPIEAPTGDGWDPELYSKRHYGWVVEVDPFDPTSTPRKHAAMGRFHHENVAVVVADDGTVVAYMGDDRADCCIYKFVADKKYTDARAAALALRATPLDRPEDIEVHPLDGGVYIALTNNTGHGNFHGQIIRLVESDGYIGESFDWSVFATGGPQSGFSSPDNLVFDGEGNLWMVPDISTSRYNKGIYKFHGNNALFFCTEGPMAGYAFQFASGPVHCELTSPVWTPDGKTLFLAVQHPGEQSTSLTELTSHWPNGGEEAPLPAVVAIKGFPG